MKLFRFIFFGTIGLLAAGLGVYDMTNGHPWFGSMVLVYAIINLYEAYTLRDAL